MAETVIILGAGASADAGAPVMNSFLERADDLARLKKVGPDGEAFETVFQAIASLKTAQAQVLLDTYNLESVFSAFDMARVVGQIGDLPEAKVKTARDSLVAVIARTLVETVRFPVSRDGVEPHQSYGSMANVMYGLVSREHGRLRDLPAILSLNYDIALDYALERNNIPFTYCLDEEGQSQDAMHLLKLHGSLNWTRCAEPQCGKPLSVPISSVASSVGINRWGLEVSEVSLDVVARLGRETHCQNAGASKYPLLVPPTWGKTDMPGLQHVWRQAARDLGNCRYLLIIGYSFPDTDEYFRYLLALGLSRARVQRITVVNPDDRAFAKLRDWVSPTLRSRVHFIQSGFDRICEAFQDVAAGRPPLLCNCCRSSS